MRKSGHTSKFASSQGREQFRHMLHDPLLWEVIECFRAGNGASDHVCTRTLQEERRGRPLQIPSPNCNRLALLSVSADVRPGPIFIVPGRYVSTSVGPCFHANHHGGALGGPPQPIPPHPLHPHHPPPPPPTH